MQFSNNVNISSNGGAATQRTHSDTLPILLKYYQFPPTQSAPETRPTLLIQSAHGEELISTALHIRQRSKSKHDLQIQGSLQPHQRN